MTTSALPTLGPIGRRRALQLGAAAAVTTGCTRQPAKSASGPQPIRLVATAGAFAATVQQLMKDKGYLQEMGLAPSYLSVTDGTKVISALISGDADLCTASGFGQVLPSIERGGPLKVVAGSEVLLLYLIYSANPAIKTLKDLEGRTVGTGPIGALLHSIVMQLLTKNHVDVSKVKFLNVGSSADVFRAVVGKTVDAGPSEVDYLPLAEQYGVHGVQGGTFWDNLSECTNQASYTSTKAIQEKRDVLVRALAAFAKLYRFIQGPDSKDAYLAARAKALSKNQPEEGLAQWEFFQKHQAFAVNLALSEERVRYMQNVNVSLGVQKSVMPYDRVTDMSLAQDALKLIGKI
jgi:ABC-type nitrate/sulfonate/bicarbonate transport system substrate-binding protein